jgi:hypothetical protein
MGCHGSRAAEAGVDIKKELSLGGATSCCACVHSIWKLYTSRAAVRARREVQGETEKSSRGESERSTTAYHRVACSLWRRARPPLPATRLMGAEGSNRAGG